MWSSESLPNTSCLLMDSFPFHLRAREMRGIIIKPKQLCAGFHCTCRAPLSCITMSLFFFLFLFPPSHSQRLQTGTRHWAILLVPLIAKSFWLWSEATTVKLQSDAWSVAWQEHWAPSEQSDHCSTCQVLRGLRLHFNGQKWRWRRRFRLRAARHRGHTGRRKLNLAFTFLKCQSGQLEEHRGAMQEHENKWFHWFGAFPTDFYYFFLCLFNFTKSMQRVEGIRNAPLHPRQLKHAGILSQKRCW